MTINKTERVDTVVEVTNFFAGGDQKRKEVLAQPEGACSCGCSSSCFSSPEPISSFTSASTATVAHE